MWLLNLKRPGLLSDVGGFKTRPKLPISPGSKTAGDERLLSVAGTRVHLSMTEGRCEADGFEWTSSATLVQFLQDALDSEGHAGLLRHTSGHSTVAH